MARLLMDSLLSPIRFWTYFLAGIYICLSACAPQLTLDLSETKVTLPLNDSIFYFGISPDDTKINIQTERRYYWFHGDTIHTSMEGYFGQTLHGPFSLTTKEYDLVEKGQFHHGLKDGKWSMWYPDGGLKEVNHWRQGVRDGAFKEYYPNGTVKRSGSLRNSQLDGEIKSYASDGSLIKEEKYKQGSLVVGKDKENSKRSDPTNPPVKQERQEKESKAKVKNIKSKKVKENKKKTSNEVYQDAEVETLYNTDKKAIREQRKIERREKRLKKKTANGNQLP